MWMRLSTIKTAPQHIFDSPEVLCVCRLDMSKNSKQDIVEGGNNIEDVTSRKKITWDEDCIKEHDKERGTRMKIVEPNTPYVYYDEDSDKAKSATGEYAGAPAHTSTGELDFTELSSKLTELKKAKEAVTITSQVDASSKGIEADVYTVSMADAIKKSKKPKNKDFANKRKAHYNEFKMMKQWKMSQNLNEDD